MRNAACALALMAALGLVGATRASGPVGVYALVKKVVLEPNGRSPARIQVWGTFALAKGGGERGYSEPVQGYLYYSLDTDNLDHCRKEWASLKKVAGTGQCVAFGEQGQSLGRVRLAEDKPKDPDVYPIASGLFKIRGSDPQARRLKEKAS